MIDQTQRAWCHAVSHMFPSEAEPCFETPELLEKYWAGRKWGMNSEMGQLRMVMLHRPDEEINTIDESKYDPSLNAIIDVEKGYYYGGKTKPDLAKMQAEHDAYANVLRKNGVEVIYNNKYTNPGLVNCINTRDIGTAIPGGIIIGRGSNYMRRGEELAATRTLAEIGMPILKTIHGTGTFEGGNFMFLDPKHAMCGYSTRTNLEGLRQLRETLADIGIELFIVQVPGHDLHIDGMITMVDYDLALVDLRTVPFALLEKLKELGIRYIEKAPDERTTAINLVPICAKKVVMIKGFEKTADILCKNGIDVIEVEYEECMKKGGGLHCGTQALIRDFV